MYLFGTVFGNPARAGRRVLWLALALTGSLLLLFVSHRQAAAGVPVFEYDLIVVKQAWQSNGVDPYAGDWAFDYTCDSADFDCLEITLTDEDASYTYENLDESDSLTLTETVPDGWTAAVSCKDQNNIEIAGGVNSVDLSDDLVFGGDTITCVFSNTADPTTGTLIVIKDAQPDDPQDFNYNLYYYQPTFGLQGQFSLDDDGADSNPLSDTYQTTTLTPGTYGVSEAGTTGWEIGILCVSTNPDREFPGISYDPNNNGYGIAFDIEAGETITCTFTNTPLSPPPTSVFMSANAAGTTGDGLAFGPEDILEWDGSTWSLYFNGSDAGLIPSGNAKHDINAFALADPAGSNDIFISFAQNARTVPGITGKVDGTDLVVWGGAYFLLALDGSDVGLTNLTEEKIDAVHYLPGEASPINGGDCPFGYFLISTAGPGKVPNHSGGTLNFSGEDVLGFCATQFGTNTAGLWHMVLDGSAQGMPKNATDSLSLSADGNVLYLTTKGAFNVDTATGGHSMVYGYDLVNEEFFGPLFVAADEGLPKKVDGLQVEGSLP